MIRNAEARNAEHKTGAAVAEFGLRILHVARPTRHAHAVKQIDFFVERHFFQHHGGALVGRKLWIHPGMVAIEFFADA